MRITLTIFSVLMINTAFAQTDSVDNPEVLYPFHGLVFEIPSDSTANKIDTVFISECEVQIIIDSKVVKTGVTDKSGKYKIEIPEEWFFEKYIFVKTNCDKYQNLQSGPKVLFGIVYPKNGMRSDFELERKR